MNSDDAIETLAESDDATLRRAITELELVLQDRSRARGDLDALTEVGFSEGFTPAGHAKAPWVEAGIVICPGSVLEKSARSHDCSFVNVGGDWVWASPELLIDTVRRVPIGSRIHQRSISLLDAREGLNLDVLVSKKRQDSHQLQSSISYTVEGGGLVVVSTRALKTSSHR